MSTIATVIIARQNKYIRAFRKAGAVSPGSSIRLTDHGMRNSFIFDRLVRMGIIVPVGNDLYYLDEQKEMQVRKRRILIMIVVSVLILIAMLLFINTQNR